MVTTPRPEIKGSLVAAETGAFFVGDVALPFPGNRVSLTGPAATGPTVVNLEGALLDPGQVPPTTHALFNHSSLIEFFHRTNVVAASLANNHVHDLPGGLVPTIDALTSAGLAHAGAGKNLTEASEPRPLDLCGYRCHLLAAGWTTIGCVAATSTRPGVNPLEPQRLLRAVRQLRDATTSDRIIVLLHWGFELEIYPHPAHRQLAFALIDEGADLIVGSHSHCVQGVERHAGGTVAFGVGNWLLPNDVFFAGQLRYPPLARRQLALEWRPVDRSCRQHWYDFDSESAAIRHVATEASLASPINAAATPFAGLSHQDYLRWFRVNRRKKMLLPIYGDFRHTWQNYARDLWVRTRSRLLILASRLRIKGPPR